MKYLKKYENTDPLKFKFILGEKVVCVVDEFPVESLIKGEKYTIIERKRFSGRNFYAVSDINENEIRRKNKLSFFGEKVFSKIIDYDSSKYNV